MSGTRVFVPYSFARLQARTDAGSTGSPGGPPLVEQDDTAHAVTAALRAEFPAADDEELEYLAMTAAAQQSLALVGPEGPYARMVLAVDVASVTEVGSDDPSLVAVGSPVLLTDLVSVHVDSDDAAPDVRAAHRAVTEDDAVDDERVVRCLDHELGWYAATELDEVARRTDGGRDGRGR